MFHVKICGVTSPEDARLVCACNADAIGLNFVAGSPRRVSRSRAREVAAAVSPGVLRIGVFAGTSVAEMLDTVQEVGLDAVQLHGLCDGDEGPVDPPERCRELGRLPVIRALRLDPPEASDCLATARRWLAEADRAGAAPSMVIIDAAVTRSGGSGLGGTGAIVDWAALARAVRLPVTMALAGGLTPANVAEAIRSVRPDAVDTASGVETIPGRKDAGKVRDFVAAARLALHRSA